MSIAVRTVLVFLLLAVRGLAQHLGASATFVPETTSVGRPVEYRVTITAGDRVVDLPNLAPPDGLEFESAGTTQRLTSDGAGNIFSTSVLTYRAVPPRPGEYTVPAFEVEVDGKTVRVPSAKLTVNPLGPNDLPYQPLKVVLDLPNREFYPGETVQGRLLFLSTPDEAVGFVQHIAKTTGSVLFKPSRMGRPQQEISWQGKTYAGVAMPVEITPLFEGDTALTCEANVQLQRLDPGGFRGLPIQTTVTSEPARLRVVALPRAGRPEGFTGGIGDFKLGSPKLSASEVQAGEPITLSFTLTGDGNLESVPAPEMGSLQNWTFYKPTSDFSYDENSGIGEKTFTYTLVPRREGSRGTPPIPFAFFNPAKRQFEDITIPPMPVKVTAPPGGSPGEPAAAAAEAAEPAAAPAEPVPVLTGLSEKPGMWVGSIGPSFRSFYLAQLVPPVLLLLVFAWRKRREYLAAHPEIPLRRKARSAARRALSDARAAARRGDAPEFLRAGAGALCHAASKADTAQAASLTPIEVVSALEGEAAQAARTIFTHADVTRYAPAAGELPKPSALLPGLERAVAILSARP